MSDGFSPEWEAAYAAGGHQSVWPWSDMVSMVMRHARPAHGYRRILELGCGAGANIPFFLAIGTEYWAIEGSSSAVEDILARHPELRGRLMVGDFTRQLPGEDLFDAIVDRSSLTHNTTEGLARGLALARSRLRAGGKFIAIDWFSSHHQDATLGEAVDSHTRRDIPTPQFTGLGRVHFSDRDHLVRLVEGAGFRVELLEHYTREQLVPAPAIRAYWHLVAAVP